MSIREFCRQHRLKESRFYWWQRKLKVSRGDRIRKAGVQADRAGFAWVSDEAGMIDAGIELVLGDSVRRKIDSRDAYFALHGFAGRLRFFQ